MIVVSISIMVTKKALGGYNDGYDDSNDCSEKF